ncbi:hypothetical protein AB205_0195760 [Aquarana catesbeiana]|uniref:Myb/SANT-like DNA-binding domain-containing protein n=1 Tax=Aquarana catesbeiana TaxID=8400 RepID=A0A2G9SE23_AQUCT|nr:hypothetical protein AB205_0195760 [Aquarana catesbeiana]
MLNLTFVFMISASDTPSSVHRLYVLRTRVMLYIHCAFVQLRPHLTFFLVYSPPLLVRHSGEEHMAETQQVSDNYTNEEEEEESPEPETSRSRRRRFKASNMSFGKMLEMVDILKRTDYDRKKAKIMAKVIKSLQKNFGVRRSKDQLRKRWWDLKLREHEQYRRIRRVLQKSK